MVVFVEEGHLYSSEPPASAMMGASKLESQPDKGEGEQPRGMNKFSPYLTALPSCGFDYHSFVTDTPMLKLCLLFI